MVRYRMLFMMLFLLIGCSDEAPKDGYDQVTGIDRANEFSSEEDFGPKESTSGEDFNSEEQAATQHLLHDYDITFLSDNLSAWNENINEFDQLHTEGMNDLKYMVSDPFLMQVTQVLGQMEVLIKETRDQEAPSPAQDVHSKMLEAAEHFEFVVSNYYEAAKNQDAEILEKCVTQIENGKQSLINAVNIVEEYNETQLKEE